VILLKGIFWGSLGGLVWTHAGYPLAAAALARLRPRPVRKRDETPRAVVVVPAHDEEDVIAARVENLLALDYPPELVEIVVASDASTDRTDEIVEEIAAGEPRVRLLRCPRGGKLRALDRAVRETESDVVAFSDANTTWEPDVLRKLVSNFADPDVAYVCGRLELRSTDGTNREGVYWRYELWLREQESLLGSITGGNGSVYAVRRSDYVEFPQGHDLGFPFLQTRRGRRAVYEPEAVGYEKPSRDIEDEYRRKVRMFRWCWRTVFEERMTSGVPPLYALEIASHRHLRYASGLLHLALLGSSAALVGAGPVYRLVLAGQLAFLGLAGAGKLRLPVPGAALAWYYTLVSWATVVALARNLREGGAPLTWERAEGTR
jgi:glycosyltransferase involved in cell wall biosynthesis